MARSFSNVKFFSVPILDGFSHVLARRGYAATTQSATSGGATYVSGKITPKSVEDKVNGVVSEKVSWVPDPVTGYYKPENIKEKIDVAELRASLISNKFDH